MIRRPPRPRRTDTLFPYTTRFRSKSGFFEARIKGLNPPHNTGWFKVCAPGANQNPALIAANVPAGQARAATVELRLDAAAKNDLANKALAANLTVIATQPNQAPTNQTDQPGNSRSEKRRVETECGISFRTRWHT